MAPFQSLEQRHLRRCSQYFPLKPWPTIVVWLIHLILYTQQACDVHSPSNTAFLLVGAFLEDEGKEVVSKCVNENRISIPVGDNSWASKWNKDALVSVDTAFYTCKTQRLKTKVAKYIILMIEQTFPKFYLPTLLLGWCYIYVTKSKPRGFSSWLKPCQINLKPCFCVSYTGWLPAKFW